VSSQEVSKYYAEAFNMSEENIRPIGIPRIDLFFNEKLKQEAINRVYKAYPMLNGKKLVLYAPTFRGANQANMHMNIPFDLDQVLTCLDENTVFGLKMHPFIKDLPDLSGYENVIDLSLYPEINDILLVTDQLITDYSSIVFEYSLLERPMIFYAHDRSTYIKERDFYYEYESLVPGPIVENTDELIDALQNTHFNKEKIIEFKQKFFDEPDGQATKRFINQIILKTLNLPLSPFYLFLLEVYNEFSVLHNNFILDENQNQLTELTTYQQQLLLILELIQYDILEGKEYTLDANFFDTAK